METNKLKTCEICEKEIKKDPKLSNEQFNKKKYCSIICRRKAHSKIMKGKLREANSNWKGNVAQYSAYHKRIETIKGKPKECEICGTTRIFVVYDWANLTGNYNDILDYKRMCRSCHKKYDLKRNLTQADLK